MEVGAGGKVSNRSRKHEVRNVQVPEVRLAKQHPPTPRGYGSTDFHLH